MKRSLLVAVTATAALAVPAASTATAGTSAPSARAAGSGQTIVDIAAGDPRFTTLVKLVKKAGLAETLSGEGPFTVFAPTNAAFKKVPAKTLRALSKDTDKLKAVLTYHVVAGEVKAADVVKLKSAKTVNGKSIRISVRGGNVFLNRSTKVTKTDIDASNGVVHVINKVLIP